MQEGEWLPIQKLLIGPLTVWMCERRCQFESAWIAASTVDVSNQDADFHLDICVLTDFYERCPTYDAGPSSRSKRALAEIN